MPSTSIERRAGAGWIRSVLRSALAVGLLLIGGTVAPAPARAANTLSNGTVSPASGTTATIFTFSVVYDSTPPSRAATAVTANVAGLSIPLTLTAGAATAGTYAGSSTLPAGSWPVTFLATVSNGDATLDASPVDVSPVPTPSPTFAATATPVPTATPLPSVGPSATTAPTPLVPPPTATPGTPPAPVTPTPGRAASPPPAAPGSDAAGSPSARESGSAGPSGSPDASGGGSPNASPPAPPSPDPRGVGADAAPSWRFGRGAWLLMGGTLSVAGTGILAGQWVRTRRARPRSATTPGRGPRPGRTARR